MPGAARKLRLVTDWTVGLFFGRASAELGQLGRVPPLDGDLAGETAASAVPDERERATT